MQSQQLLPHLFRTEYGKLIAVLCKTYGFGQFETAEDIVSDTFLSAAESWGMHGIPANPAGWLYTVAKNKSKNFLRRNKIFAEKISPELESRMSVTQEADLDLSPENVLHSRIAMMFAICHPEISESSQVAISLKTLCGFGINEIAAAFLSNAETIQRRISRAVETLKRLRVQVEVPASAQLNERLSGVLRTLYLLFNAGYYSASDTLMRRELCAESLELALLLVEYPGISSPPVYALLALMCFHASRFDARVSDSGEAVLFADQDRSLWDFSLIRRGHAFLIQAATGDQLSKYHLEAAIAYWHTSDSDEKWANILKLYDELIRIDGSPTIALSRIFAVAQAVGFEEAILAAENFPDQESYMFHALMGHLHEGGDSRKAAMHFQAAISKMANSPARAMLKNRLTKLKQ